MIRELMKKLQIILRPALTKNGTPSAINSVEILRKCYYDLSRLTEQINTHSGKAPYPHVAQQLRQIAVEKRHCVSLLREKIVSLRGELEELPLDLKSGKNHWGRIVQDLEDQKALENSLLERALRLADEAPEISGFLKGIAAEQLPHKEILLDLVARADPQAEQS